MQHTSHHPSRSILGAGYQDVILLLASTIHAPPHLIRMHISSLAPFAVVCLAIGVVAAPLRWKSILRSQEFKRPEFKQPEFKQPEFKQPEFKRPEIGDTPEIIHQKIAHYDEYRERGGKPDPEFPPYRTSLMSSTFVVKEPWMNKYVVGYVPP
ncbi:hypothetical protein F5148DRAFT_164796 [Russula earlei]|uniref:Uncharacterized protein n=1 Tax=Russula earlei TaxID=71964 RepID=A0ACC0TS11_9AGAM|nr:hypothetical protein F5148DRAFT_164796 [Russula earlei]